MFFKNYIENLVQKIYLVTIYQSEIKISQNCVPTNYLVIKQPSFEQVDPFKYHQAQLNI